MNDFTHLWIMAIVFFVVIPLFKGLWEFIGKERPPKTSRNVPKTYRSGRMDDLVTLTSGANVTGDVGNVQADTDRRLEPLQSTAIPQPDDLAIAAPRFFDDGPMQLPAAAGGAEVANLDYRSIAAHPGWGESPDDNGVAVRWWQARGAEFCGIEYPEEALQYCLPNELDKVLRAAILEQKVSSDTVIHRLTKNEDGGWTDTSQALSEVIGTHFKLNVLYRPIWAHAMAGLKWGILGGIALKLLDTAVTLLTVEPGAGICFLVALLVCFIPRVGIPGMVVLALVMGRFYTANFFIVGMVAAVTGAVLGILPGMGIGGLIGLVCHRSLPRAPDATAERSGIAWKAAWLPLAGGVGLIMLYLFVFNPWIVGTLSE